MKHAPETPFANFAQLEPQISPRVARAVDEQLKNDPDTLTAQAQHYLEAGAIPDEILLSVGEYVLDAAKRDRTYRRTVTLPLARYLTAVAWQLENDQARQRRRRLPH